MIFCEAETFEDLGGWTIDTQCVEAMGAPYLLAHGIGHPVADAWTRILIPASGCWRVLVRTRDWTAVWGRGTPAGRFQVFVDGVPLPQVLGTNGPEWRWQLAGSLPLQEGEHILSLHDLTGFDGRCDAVCLLAEGEPPPPDDVEALSLFRSQACGAVIAEDPTEYDLLVCGGGFGGLCAAVAAKRLGLRVLLVQDRAVVGGCGSSEIRVWVGGKVNVPPYPALGNIASAISPIKGQPGDKKEFELFEDARKELLLERGTELLLEEMMVSAEVKDGCVRSVVTRAIRTGCKTRRRARFFVDATGDALLARLAGCKTMYGCEGRAQFGETLAPDVPSSMVMGHSTLWETSRKPHPVSFPDIDWGLEFNDDNALARFDCCWDWETGQFRNQVRDIERIRDYGLMTCYANWSFLKNRSRHREKWANMELEWLSPIGGKRESYRVVGDVILTQNDIERHVEYEDATGCITWSSDLHFPDPENQRKFGEAFQSCAYHRGIREPYPVPYRCLYAHDASNLFLAGRCLSLSHVAFSCTRVMRTLGMLGEVVGMATLLCVRHDCTPREVYQTHLPELKELMRQGIPVEPPCSWATEGGEAYHFMRPVATCGNPTENCWIRFDNDGRPLSPIPSELIPNIQALGILPRNGTTFPLK